MRTKILLTLFSCVVFTPLFVRADEYESYTSYDAQDGSLTTQYDASDDTYSEVDYRVPSSYAPRPKLPSAGLRDSRSDALAQARFETQMMREQAQQETYRQQIAARQNSPRIAETSREIQENQRRYENNSNMINNVNQAANAASNVARQAKTIGTLMNGGWDAYRDAFNW